MASKQKITLNQPQAIPLDRSRLSDANVRRVKPGESVAELADSIARRGLLHNLNVRPILDSEGNATGDYEVPAGGRRIRSEEHTSELQSLMRHSYAVFCLTKKTDTDRDTLPNRQDL